MITRKASALATASSPQEGNLLVFEDAPEFMEDHNGSPTLENVDSKVKAAQEQLMELRRQQEEIERQKQHLEALRVKQERFVAGKRELMDKIGRSASLVERELYDAQKRVEEFALTHDEFRRHLEVLKSLQPEKWHRTQVSEELDDALAAIEDAESGYAKGIRRLHAMGPQEPISTGSTSLDESGMPAAAPSYFAPEADNLKTWMRRGFAFTLPLMGTVIVAIVLIRLMF